MFHFHHRDTNGRDAIDEKRRSRPKSKKVVAVEVCQPEDSDCNEWMWRVRLVFFEAQVVGFEFGWGLVLVLVLDLEASHGWIPIVTLMFGKEAQLRLGGPRIAQMR
jgi:hypothetical protein